MMSLKYSTGRKMMNKYRCRGTVELNFDVIVHADNEEEAEKSAIMKAEDGVGLDVPTGDTEVSDIDEVE